MPQTCYAPRFGCYSGNDRFTHRYPAFHGTYYRRPYNYRNEFDYPWHAGLHEPTSLFSYNVEEEVLSDEPTDGEAAPAMPPRPTPAGDASLKKPSSTKAPSTKAQSISQGRGSSRRTR
jgi:hypothetical protein